VRNILLSCERQPETVLRGTRNKRGARHLWIAGASRAVGAAGAAVRRLTDGSGLWEYQLRRRVIRVKPIPLAQIDPAISNREMREHAE